MLLKYIRWKPQKWRLNPPPPPSSSGAVTGTAAVCTPPAGLQHPPPHRRREHGDPAPGGGGGGGGRERRPVPAASRLPPAAQSRGRLRGRRVGGLLLQPVPGEQGGAGGAAALLCQVRKSAPALLTLHCKKGYRFSRPQPEVTYQTVPCSALNTVIKLFPSRESLVSDIPAGEGKMLIFFTVYGVQLTPMTKLDI